MAQEYIARYRQAAAEFEESRLRAPSGDCEGHRARAARDSRGSPRGGRQSRSRARRRPAIAVARCAAPGRRDGAAAVSRKARRARRQAHRCRRRDVRSRRARSSLHGAGAVTRIRTAAWSGSCATAIPSARTCCARVSGGRENGRLSTAGSALSCNGHAAASASRLRVSVPAMWNLCAWLSRSLSLGALATRHRGPVDAAPLPRLRVSREQAISRHGGRPAVFLARRHRLGTVPSAQSRGRGALSSEPCPPAVHRHPGGRARGVRRLTAPNAYGHIPLRDNDPRSLNERLLRARGLDRRPRQRARHVRRLPSDMGRQVEPSAGHGTGNLHARKRRALRRVAGPALQGRRASSGSSAAIARSRPTRNCAIIRAMARGLRAGDGGAHLMTFHPPAATAHPPGSTTTSGSTSTCARTAMRRSSPGATTRRACDYDRTPVKPVVDGEPIYEDHPVSFNAKRTGALHRQRRPQAALLGSVHRRVRAHLRPSFGLADVDASAGADQQSADAVVRGDRSARRGADAVRPRTDGVASFPHAYSGSETSSCPARCPTSVPGAGATTSSRPVTRAAATRWFMRRSAGRSTSACR